MVSRMIIQQRFIEHLCFNVVVLLLLSCKKLNFGVSYVVADGTMKNWCMENEKEALLKFKQGVVDDYHILSSWGREEDKKDCCKWRGVKCSNHTGHVTTLDLRNRGSYDFSHSYKPLRGKISLSLLDLQHLTYLDLSYNELFRTIPHQLGNLTNLHFLSLGGYFTSSLSVRNLDWLSDLHLLRHLHLSSIDLGKIDWLRSINKLSFLSELHLVSCKLSRIISPSLHLTNFSSIPLTKIVLSYNNFIYSSVYNWLFNFSSSLVDIDMSFNPLGGRIPDAFGNMMSLESLGLSNCSLEVVIPKSFKNFSCLRSLKLSANNFAWQLPELFQTLTASETSLEILQVGMNRVFGSLPDFTRFSSLRELGLSSNKLKGSFPKSFGQSSLLVYLSLSYNELNGSFPDLASFPLLRKLYLSYNKLNGRLPKSIGQLSNLKELDLSFNLLTLEFSSNWTPLFQLDAIKLANCKLGHHFPEWLQSQNNFSVLDISSAGISDTVPYWFWDLSPRLEYLNIADNQIHGMLPDSLLKFVNFPTIDLRSNHFKGPIPLLPRNMSSLNLSKNMFSGSIISLCSIAIEFLSYLDLSNNLLSGEVPDCWISAKHLKILDLANNNFSGKIPTTFGFKSTLNILNLRHNNFIGELPSSLRNCRMLEVIDMSENKLSGKLPSVEYWLSKR